MTPPRRQKPLKVLLRAPAIRKRVEQIGRQISNDYRGQHVHLIAVLKGAAVFLSDLVREIRADVSLDFIAVSSYENGGESSGQVRLTKDLDNSIEGVNVILVEDILDTGLTLTYLLHCLQQRNPRSVRVAALLDKSARRVKPVRADYIGFQIPDHFVVGYGMDYGERYRNLKDICVLSLPVL